MKTIQELLRAGTRQEHEQIERVINLSRSSFTSESYLHLLKAFYGFYLPIEQELLKFKSEFLALGLNLEERLKLSLIKADLLFMGTDPKTLKVNLQGPIPVNLTQSLGLMYVLEGSTMGGQIIHQRLVASGIFPAEHSICFHNPYGEQTQKKWNDFKVVLNALPLNESEDALFMAKKTFSGLESWIQSF